MTFGYCPKCGDKLIPKAVGDEGEIPYCEKCSRPWFPFSYPCVIYLCMDENGEVLLIKQSYGIIRYVCVAGYIKSGEDAETAAKREIAEETGLETLGVRYLYSRYYEKHDNLMLAFACRVRRSELKLSGELSEAAWFSPKEAYDALFEGAYGRDMLTEIERLEKEGLLGI